MYNNSSVLGDDYYIGEPTEQCVANSEYKSSSLATGNKWYYWLRHPSAHISYGRDSVRYVGSSGYVNSYNAYNGSDGVRPAFYLNTESASFNSGSGTESDPYTVESPSGFADYQNEILNYIEVDGKYVVNSVAVNNTAENISCKIYAAVYDSDGILKGCGIQPAEIAANDDTGVDTTVNCELESGDTIKTFMWNDSLESLTTASEITIEDSESSDSGTNEA